MPTIFSIQYLLPSGQWSGAVTFADAGIATASRKLVNQGVDTCEIKFAGSRPSFIAPLSSGSVVRIMRDDYDGYFGHTEDFSSNPHGWFVGTVIAPKRAIAGNSESASLVLNGPWWQLAQIVYQQQGLFYAPVGTTTLSGDTVIDTPEGPKVSFGDTVVTLSPAPVVMLSSDIILTQAQAEGVPMSAADTLADALAYALAKGARFTVGTLPADQPIPSEQTTDPTVADMLKKVLRWLPSVTAWFDYTQDPPALNFAARADRAPITLAMGGDSPQVAQATIQARPDLVLPGVRLQFLRRLNLTSVVSTVTTTTPAPTTENPNPQPVSTTTYGANAPTVAGYISSTKGAGTGTTDPTSGATVSTATNETSQAVNSLEIDQAGPNPVGIGALVATVQLQGGDVVKGINTTAFEPTPVGLALTIYNARKVLSYEGSASLKNQELVNLGNPIGRTLCIEGGDPEWSAMAAEIQNTTEDVATGATSLTIGAPTHLGPSDLAALLQANRLRQYVDLGTSLLRNNGGAALPPANPLPPGPAAPPGQNGGHGGPSTAPDGGTEVHDGFTGILTPYAGSKTTTAEDGAYYTTNGSGGINPNSGTPPAFGALGTAPAETSQGGQADSFYATLNGSAGGEPQYDVPPANITCHWETSTTNTATHSEGNLDLTSFSAFQYSYAELRGSRSYSDATGNTRTEDYSEDCTSRLGTKSWYRVYASGATPYKYSSPNDGFPRASMSASISIDRIYLVPRKS